MHRYNRFKKKHLNYFSANYRTEMKLVPIIMDYCLFQFDALKFFLDERLRGSLYLTLLFSMQTPKCKRNRKVHLSNCLETNFHNISNINLRVIRLRHYS